MKPHQDDLLNFLASLVADLSVSPQGTHVSVVTYNNRVLQHFTLTAHYNVQDLQNAIKQISFRGGNDDISVGLSYVLQLISTSSQLLTTDRPTVPDVVIFITDHSDQNYLSKLYGKLYDITETYPCNIQRFFFSCGDTLELHCRGGSNEYPQFMRWTKK